MSNLLIQTEEQARSAQPTPSNASPPLVKSISRPAPPPSRELATPPSPEPEVEFDWEQEAAEEEWEEVEHFEHPPPQSQPTEVQPPSPTFAVASLTPSSAPEPESEPEEDGFVLRLRFGGAMVIVSFSPSSTLEYLVAKAREVFNIALPVESIDLKLETLTLKSRHLKYLQPNDILDVLV